MFVLDHLAVGAATLGEGVDLVQSQLGIMLERGGSHDQYGTHNMLLGLEDGLYLEVIAKDPDAIPSRGHSWFGLDDFTGPPRLANWICRADNLIDYTDTAGPKRELERGNLRWDITVPDDGSLPFGGGFPTLIKWGAGTVHPANSLKPSGLRLREFIVSHPEATKIARLAQLDDPRIKFEVGSPGFVARFEGPNGVKELR
ncbi:glyoxalase-like protein [Yoonia maritima]|uniref:Glyoxalase-like protein n=1 Tax=Yoonia maritima TaxID=1435347 RepID=A0A2T0W3E9_9RHOB|nr:VOC family protein [Yoonia maritima]PRY79720.1 glyoxalase-like protein [Yoonia maritima]